MTAGGFAYHQAASRPGQAIGVHDGNQAPAASSGPAVSRVTSPPQQVPTPVLEFDERFVPWNPCRA